ncbi:uncharacterized protein PAC_19537 [Phialocephala subalpina]|uniref:Death domain-containing protein n=1 Tax=Phialocephala subalpina TaxID=576137 RepID=A0A1L7XXA5_9HELO|nr:uncharacterized protein PAC_19537 [Phialocephala subalpina]
MAEALGILAGIAQLTSQVAQGIIKLKSYWDEIKDAPVEIASIIRDLEFINSILCDLEQEYTHRRLPDTAFNNNLLHHSLVICREGARELHDLVESLNYRSSTKSTFRKHRAALKVVYKQDQLKRYRSKLKRATHILSLAHQSYTRALLQMQLQSISSMLPAEPLQAKSARKIADEKDAKIPHPTQHNKSLTVSEVSVSSLILIIFCFALQEPTQLNLFTVLLIICFSTTVMDTKLPHLSTLFIQTIFRNPSMLLMWTTRLERHLEVPILGSVELSKQQHRKRKAFTQHKDWGVQSHIVARYHAPIWSSYKTWEFRWYRADLGWTCQLAVYNVISSKSEQFLYAKQGSLSKLRHMITERAAALSDQTEDGDTLLSIAAKNGHVDLCRWLLQSGARTDHTRFGYCMILSLPVGWSNIRRSVLKEVLYYGGWMSFYQGAAVFEIVRLLYQREEEDIFDTSNNDINTRCFFYGRKEVLVWLITQCDGYLHTTEEHVQLAINIARNTQHNAPALVRAALAETAIGTALQFKDANNITLLHRTASRLGGFAYEVQQWEKHTKYLDEGFESPQNPLEKELFSRNGWRSLLRDLNLKNNDVHSISNLGLTPMLTGFSTLIGLWDGSSSKAVEALFKFLQVWLMDLQETGIDILAYGKEERQLCISGLLHKDFHRYQIKWKTGRCTKTSKAANQSYGALRLIAFEPSKFPSDWKLWWSEPSDEFVGDFWNMCERSPTMPGSWDIALD